MAGCRIAGAALYAGKDLCYSRGDGLEFCDPEKDAGGEGKWSTKKNRPASK